jgi:hypothetical protein
LQNIKCIGFYWRFHMIFCGIVSKQFKKYLTLHVDNSKQKNMVDM